MRTQAQSSEVKFDNSPAMTSPPKYFDSLIDVIRDYPAIDNHAHPLLTEENRDRLAFEGLTSEAQGEALEDAAYTLAHATARRDLVQLYDLPGHTSWEDVKKHRTERTYYELCRLCFRQASIQCILIDDGLGGVKEMAEDYQRHDRYTHSPTRRIVRVEVIAEVCASYISISSPSLARTRRPFPSPSPHNDLREYVSSLDFRMSSRNFLEREDKRNTGTLVSLRVSPRSFKRAWKAVRKIRTWPASSPLFVIAPDWTYLSSPTALRKLRL